MESSHWQYIIHIMVPSHKETSLWKRKMKKKLCTPISLRLKFPKIPELLRNEWSSLSPDEIGKQLPALSAEKQEALLRKKPGLPAS